MMNKKSTSDESTHLPEKPEEVQITDKRPGIGGKPTTAKSIVSPEDYSDAMANAANVTIPFRASLAKPYHATLSFSDLSDEQYRVYVWPSGWKVTLRNPMKLNVSASGGHRVYTSDGISHYIPSGWNHLYWKVKENCPHFAF